MWCCVKLHVLQVLGVGAVQQLQGNRSQHQNSFWGGELLNKHYKGQDRFSQNGAKQSTSSSPPAAAGSTAASVSAVLKMSGKAQGAVHHAYLSCVQMLENSLRVLAACQGVVFVLFIDVNPRLLLDRLDSSICGRKTSTYEHWRRKRCILPRSFEIVLTRFAVVCALRCCVLPVRERNTPRRGCRLRKDRNSAVGCPQRNHLTRHHSCKDTDLLLTGTAAAVVKHQERLFCSTLHDSDFVSIAATRM